MPKVQIVIPCINLWNKYTKACLESIKTKYDYRILLIDNNSTDETETEAGKLVSNIFAHKRNTQCWSCSKSWNFGIQDGFDRGFDYIIVLNNDIILHPEAIDKMIERFEQAEENLAMITCLDIREESNPPETFLKWGADEKAEANESEHPNFSAFMINRKTWDKIGGFDEGFAPCYFEDNDYHHRIKLADMKAICLPTAMFYHYGSRTQNEALDKPICPGSAFEANRGYYKSKWGGVPGRETFSKPFNG